MHIGLDEYPLTLPCLAHEKSIKLYQNFGFPCISVLLYGVCPSSQLILYHTSLARPRLTVSGDALVTTAHAFLELGAICMHKRLQDQGKPRSMIEARVILRKLWLATFIY